MADTKVLNLINSYGIFPQEWKTRDDVNQEAIDSVQEEILSQLSSNDIAAHNNFAYSNSVAEYDSKPANMRAVPDLVNFMNLLPEDGLVLDLGAGHLRDTLYMVDPASRDSLNREGMISPSLEKKLNVIPLEGSWDFLNSCYHKISGNDDRVPLLIEGNFMNPGRGNVFGSYSQRDSKLVEVFSQGKLEPVLDGIWSCAGYMVHMAPNKLAEVTSEWSNALKKDGIFAISYINKKEGQPGTKLLASRSAPGEIKIFSHYTPQEVDEAFSHAGLKLINSSTGDYDGHGHVMSNFFGNAMYRKE